MQESDENHRLVLRETAVQHVTCARCGTRYDYDHPGQASAGSAFSLSGRDIPLTEESQKASARLDAVFARGLVVPCPGCRALTPAMRRRRMMAALQDLIYVGIALTVAWGVVLALEASGALAWGIGILALLTALGYSLKLLTLPFGGYNEARGRPAGTPGPAAASGDLFDSLKLGD